MTADFAVGFLVPTKSQRNRTIKPR